MSDREAAAWVGLFLGMLIMIFTNFLPWSYRSMAATALAECEKSLPRDMHCKITAVPEMEGNDNAGT